MNKDGMPPVSFKQRIQHFTWAWFTLPMSTGGLALLLHNTPHQFPGLFTIGTIVYILDLVVFVVACGAILTRFILVPESLTASLLHPTESLFFPTWWLALVTILNGAQLYGYLDSPWLPDALFVMFWIYIACTFIMAVVMYWNLFAAPPTRLTMQGMTPAWILPVFPIMLTGTFAGTIASVLAPGRHITVLLAGITFQGLGWMISFLMYAMLFQRLMLYGLPPPNLRPGLFMAVGPPSFTGLALLSLARGIQPNGYFKAHPDSIPTLQYLADFIAVFLWALSFWFWCIALVSVLHTCRRMTFHLVWWAFVFPNIGFSLITIQIGLVFESESIQWVASAMTVIVVIVWLVVLGFNVRAVIRKEIMMPGMDEDKGGLPEFR
ncbi:MAG: hypothetical protein GOMPHAMPRED_005742 [Gomphillus americanus]|uniref:C4-dicarboxylate transporter/malic acid transport protein n=1 Tax=Gomphillus americanus TaxID=1940652 RepID=A0A8H3IJY0_9LECA|nr:MAG: hypothetical protein GOMPHAMPRED_005742 [Gomphillus americanus]